MTLSTFNIGIAGLGTVGSGVAEIIQKQAALLGKRSGRHIRVIAVSARDKSRERGFSMEHIEWMDNPLEMVEHPDIHAVVELIGGSDGIAKALCEKALQSGKHVITANKALIAHHGGKLAELAEARQVQLQFEAAVAGGIPIIKLLKEGMAANRIDRMIGILNGTCNYILSTMETSKRQFQDVLEEAQKLGYAEADPGFDIDGVDAAHKLCILSALAFSTLPAIGHIYCEGIRMISAADIQAAEELGYKIRLIGVTLQKEEGIELRVHPALLPADSPIAEVDGVYNAVHLFGDAIGDLFVEGRGAGKYPTASAVIADIVDVAKGNPSLPFIIPAKELKQPSLIPMESYDSAYYLRLQVADHPGVLAAITQTFSQHDISVATLIQHPASVAGEATIILTTHLTQEKLLRQALQDISALKSVRSSPCMIRIEET